MKVKSNTCTKVNTKYYFNTLTAVVGIEVLGVDSF